MTLCKENGLFLKTTQTENNNDDDNNNYDDNCGDNVNGYSIILVADSVFGLGCVCGGEGVTFFGGWTGVKNVSCIDHALS